MKWLGKMTGTSEPYLELDLWLHNDLGIIYSLKGDLTGLDGSISGNLLRCTQFYRRTHVRSTLRGKLVCVLTFLSLLCNWGVSLVYIPSVLAFMPYYSAFMPPWALTSSTPGAFKHQHWLLGPFQHGAKSTRTDVALCDVASHCSLCGEMMIVVLSCDQIDCHVGVILRMSKCNDGLCNGRILWPHEGNGIPIYTHKYKRIFMYVNWWRNLKLCLALNFNVIWPTEQNEI